MASAIQIPDLRFEQSFMRSLQSNSLKINSNKSITAKNEKSEPIEQPLPVEITPYTVIYTVIKDQILMPFAQGLAMTTILMLCKPVLFKVFEHGRSFGLKVFNGLGLSNNRTSNMRLKRI